MIFLDPKTILQFRLEWMQKLDQHKHWVEWKLRDIALYLVKIRIRIKHKLGFKGLNE